MSIPRPWLRNCSPNNVKSRATGAPARSKIFLHRFFHRISTARAKGLKHTKFFIQRQDIGGLYNILAIGRNASYLCHPSRRFAAGAQTKEAKTLAGRRGKIHASALAFLCPSEGG